jgi:predicted HTH transcriptional regulator
MFTEPVEDTINAQLKTLEQEKKKLEQALALVKGKAATRRRGPAKKKPGRPRKATTAAKRKPAAKKATRSRQGGTRADQALAFLAKNPGATAAEVSKGIGVSGPHAHQVLARLQEKKAVKKKGKTYTAA